MDDTEVVKSIYAALARKDLDGVLELTHVDFVVTQDPELPWGGKFEGHDGLAQFALLLVGSISSTLTIAEMFEADGTVVQYGRTTGTVIANGNQFDIPEVHVWRIEDGKAIEAHFSIDTSAMLAALA